MCGELAFCYQLFTPFNKYENKKNDPLPLPPTVVFCWCRHTQKLSLKSAFLFVHFVGDSYTCQCSVLLWVILYSIFWQFVSAVLLFVFSHSSQLNSCRFLFNGRVCSPVRVLPVSFFPFFLYLIYINFVNRYFDSVSVYGIICMFFSFEVWFWNCDVVLELRCPAGFFSLSDLDPQNPELSESLVLCSPLPVWSWNWFQIFWNGEKAKSACRLLHFHNHASSLVEGAVVEIKTSFCIIMCI